MIEKIQKNIKSLSKITPILAMAIIVHFFLSSYYDKSGMSLWGVPIFLTFVVLISLYSVFNTQKELKLEESQAEKREEELQKLLSSLNVILAANLVSVVLIGLNIAYLIIRHS